MDDLTITRLCAEAMGLELGPDWNQGYVMLGGHSGILPSKYDPLHDDAQAMALVKKFHLELYWIGAEDEDSDEWLVSPSTVKLSNCGSDIKNSDLNRAICECVAKIQASK